MRKIIIVLILTSVILTSCISSSDKGAFFDYQNGASCVSGTWNENGCEYSVVLTMGEITDGERDRLILEFVSPDTLKGTKFAFERGELTATLGDMTVTMNAETREKIFRLAEMFSLESKGIRDIKVDKEGNTVANGSQDGTDWTVTTDENGCPCRIEYGGSRFAITEFSPEKAETK
ncbi:MAG: hypothetical protein PUC29_00790 [Clostridia bacterium]|nr:hypothetical protein [Clostridia bacterium]